MMMKMQIFLFIFITVIARCPFSEAEGPVIKTLLGSVMGQHRRSYEGRIFSAFEGIPYAEPPIGDLRFKEPQPVKSWSNTLIANRTYVCIQYTYVMPRKDAKGVEDCLYLYVYVPRETIKGDENLNVVVHIHGGAFIMGDPKTLAGPDYIMDRDLVYVSMNYRLGILGFLSTEDEVVPGNNGLRDQALAMQWIKENIRYFGGNPDSITLTGASAGAASVHFHYLSPLSTGLFHRGFSQSGTALNTWALTKNPALKATELGRLFYCPTETSLIMVDCLKKLSAKEITTALSNFLVFGNALPSNPFAPVIEGNTSKAFLPDHPYTLLSKAKFNDCPWITSNTKDEGIAPVGFFVVLRKLQELEERWNELLPYTLEYYDTVDDGEKINIARKAREQYLNNKSLSMENVFELTKLHTDRLFLVDAEKAAHLQAKLAKSPVYYYYFDYLIDMTIIYKGKLPAVAHGDDFRMLFRQHDNPKVLSETDREMKNLFLDFLYSFAKKGVPQFKNVEWKPVSSTNEELDYLHISSPEDIRMEKAKELGAVSFWDSLPLKENQHLMNT